MACTNLIVGIFAASIATGLGGATAHAEILGSFDAGFGDTASTVQIDFSNGNGYLFTVHHDGTMTGLAALQLLDAQIDGFTFETQSFPWGELVAGFGVNADYEYGTGDLWPIENYWHYWVKDQSGAWVWSSEGASDRVLFAGSADAWVFGTGVPPQIVPGAPAFAVIAGLMRGTRRRK